MSYNQYRLESIDMGDASACAWRLGRADLQADLTAVEVSELVYQNSIKDIEMGEIYSNSVFTLTPALSAVVHEQPHQRREVNIPSLEDSLLSMCVKYAGGVVVSFNGRLVTRFNLAESFDASLEAIPLHDGSLFHIVLSSVGV
ncbi:hypothetical protein WA556_004223 [Blastocystis sp. ATCC 50177/Nand II]